MKQTKLLVIGPKPPPLGGARIAFELLCENSDLFSNRFSSSFINIPLFRKKYLKNLIFRIITIIKIFVKIPFNDVIVLHSSANFLFYFGPRIISYSKFFKKKIQIRFFGSKIDLLIEKKPKIKEKFLKADQILLETKGLIKFFKGSKKHSGLIWFPNSREISDITPKYNDKLNKLIYVGQLREEKGTLDLIQAFKRLNTNNSEIQLHLVGQIMQESISNSLKNNPNIIYHGVQSNVICRELISKSDIFIYPSKYISEGYPGVILEAMSLGKPILSTKFRFLTELVKDNYNGKLFDISSPREIRHQIDFYSNNPEKLKEHGYNSYVFSKKFDTNYWNKNAFNEILDNLIFGHYED